MKKVTGLILTLLAVAVMVLIPGAAQAIPETWIFATSPPGSQDVGNSKTYTGSSGDLLPASGFFTSNVAPASGTWTLVGVTATHLFEKFTSGDSTETGLGLNSSLLPVNLGSNEIQPATLVQLNFTGEKSAGFTNLMLTIGSLQTGEAFEIFGSNSSAANGATGTLLASGTGGGTATVTFGGAIPNNFIWVTATSADVLLTNGVGTIVPEPTTLLLLGFGLVGLAGIRRKFKNR